MEQTGQTRIALLNLKTQLGVALVGARVLRSKREALMKDFFKLAGDVVDARTRLNSQLERASNTLFLASAFIGKDTLTSYAHSCKRDISIDIKVRNIWGVYIPEIEERPLIRSIEARGASPIGEATLAVETTRGFEVVVDTILSTAAKESRLKRLGEEIHATTRRINALEEVLIPGLKRRIRYIVRVLEEREREEVFRLKRFKGVWIPNS